MQVTLTFVLRPPIKQTLLVLHDSANRWGVRVMKSSTRSPIAILECDERTFEESFGFKPVNGNVDLTEEQLTTYISVNVRVDRSLPK